MSKSKYTDLVCSLVLTLTLILTLLFMNGEQFGLVKVESDTISDEKGIFSERDFKETWEEQTATYIQLNDMEKLADKGAYALDGDLYLVDKGTYVLSGELNDKQIYVNAKDAKIQIVLQGVQITEENQPAIQIEKADKVFLTLAEGTVNQISVGDILTAEEDGLPDAAIYSSSDLTINGSGILQVSVGNGHGIKSKDDLVITNGNVEVNAGKTALLGKDSVRIAGGVFKLTAGADGIKANNTEDENKGYVTITGGDFIIESEKDAIQAETDINIEGGEFQVTTGGGAGEGKIHTEEFGFGGGTGHMQGLGRGRLDGSQMTGGMQPPTDGGQPGGAQSPSQDAMPNEAESANSEQPADFATHEWPADSAPNASGEPSAESTTNEASADSTSKKGLKAGQHLAISGGTLNLDCADDALHSNAHLEITGGEIYIATGDDAVHADSSLNIAGGNLNITQSYEGLEGNQIQISGGTLDIVSEDDGINAGGDSTGTDIPLLHITGGQIHVNAAGDGLDSNGNLIIDGGDICVDGPANAGNGALDTGTESGGDCVIHGGTVIALGASGMAETFSENSTQCSLHAVFSNNFNQGDEIIITDAEGTEIYRYTAEKSGDSIVFSHEALNIGEAYTVKAGEQSTTIEMSSVSSGEKTSMGMGMRKQFFGDDNRSRISG